MHNSSDSDTDPSSQSDEVNKKDAPTSRSEEGNAERARTPWDTMRSKTNQKASGKNYVQEMITKSPKLRNILRSPRKQQVNFTPPPSPPTKEIYKRPVPDSSTESESSEEDEPSGNLVEAGTETTSPSKAKKVSFSELVHKRDIEVVVQEELTEEEELEGSLSDSDERPQGPNDPDDEDNATKTNKENDLKEQTKKNNHLESDIPVSRKRSKFTLMAENDLRVNSSSIEDSSSNSSLDEGVGKRKNVLCLNSRSKSDMIVNVNKNTSSSELKSPSCTKSNKAKVDNLKISSTKKEINKKVVDTSNKYSVEESSSSSESIDRKSHLNRNNKLKGNVMSLKKKSKNNLSDSDSSVDDGVRKKNLKVDTRKPSSPSSSSSEGTTTKKSESTSRSKKHTEDILSDSHSDSSNDERKRKVPRPGKTISSSEEFEKSKVNRKSSLTRNNSKPKLEKPTKSSSIKTFSAIKSIPTSSTLKSDSSDTESTQQHTTISGFLHRKLENYCTLNNFQKVTSKTYNLSKDLKNKHNEIYIAQLPKGLDPNSLVDQTIFFNKPTTLISEDTTYTLHLNHNENLSQFIIGDGSNIDGDLNLHSVKPSGVLTVCKASKHKKKSMKIRKEPAEEIIEQPTNLKERHLLLGADYEDRVKLDRWISDKLEGLITNVEKKRKSKKSRKKTSLEKDLGEENLDIFKLLDEHTEKKSLNETDIAIMSGNKKRRSKQGIEEDNFDIFKLLDEHAEKKSVDETDNSYIKKKKKKRKSNHDDEQLTERSEMEESIDIINQFMLETGQTDIERKSKKHKKEKRQRSKSIFEENAPEIIPAKRKRSKSLMDFEPDPVVSPNKKDRASSKKRTKKAIINSTMLSPANIRSTSVFPGEESVIQKPDDDISINSFIDDLVKDVNVLHEHKKKRKRTVSSGEETVVYQKKKRKS